MVHACIHSDHALLIIHNAYNNRATYNASGVDGALCMFSLIRWFSAIAVEWYVGQRLDTVTCLPVACWDCAADTAMVVHYKKGGCVDSRQAAFRARWRRRPLCKGVGRVLLVRAAG